MNGKFVFDFVVTVFCTHRMIGVVILCLCAGDFDISVCVHPPHAVQVSSPESTLNSLAHCHGCDARVLELRAAAAAAVASPASVAGDNAKASTATHPLVPLRRRASPIPA